MTTMAEFKRFPRIKVRTISGWQSRVSCNTPAWVVKAQIIYTTLAGDERIFGEAIAKTKVAAIAKAYDAALEFFDAE